MFHNYSGTTTPSNLWEGFTLPTDKPTLGCNSNPELKKLFQYIVEYHTKDKVRALDSAIQEYILFKYKIDIYKVIKNTNNFKLKEDRFKVFHSHHGGSSYYDNGVLFMSVKSPHNTYIIKHWLYS